MADRTKIWIAEIMREMMVKKPIDKIRITDICKAAQIERSTFYYHFKDKYELVAWMFFQNADKVNVIDKIQAAKSMEQMKKELSFYKRAYEDASQNALSKYMVDYFYEAYITIAKEKLGTEKLDDQLLFDIRIYCYGTYGITREWALKDNVTPALTIVERMFQSMPESLKKVYFPDGIV